MEDLRNPRYTENSRANRNNRRGSTTKLNKIINILLLIIILIQSFSISYLVRNQKNTTSDFSATQGNSSTVVTPSPVAPTPDVSANKPAEPAATPDSVNPSVSDDEYTVVCLGDSIFQKSENDDGIANQLAALTGARVYNCAISGTTAANINTYDMEIAPADAFNLSFLVNSITSKDFTMQDNYLPQFLEQNNGHEAAVANLKSLDFTEVDVITIAYGTNDYLNNCTIDNSKSPLDNATTLGALRYAIGRIHEYYPHIRIIVMSPPFCYTMSPFNEQQTCDELNFGNGTLFDYAANYKQIAIDYNVEFVDVLNDSGMNKNNIKNYVVDGVHLNSTGKALVAELLANQIKQGMN